VMNAMSRMSPPQFGHSSGNSSPTRASSFAQAIREVSCEGLAPAAQQSVPVPVSLPFPAAGDAAGDRVRRPKPEEGRE
jgi:DNA-binding transcriptional regulator YdaS (Cro superfamily)